MYESQSMKAWNTFRDNRYLLTQRTCSTLLVFIFLIQMSLVRTDDDECIFAAGPACCGYGVFLGYLSFFIDVTWITLLCSPTFIPSFSTQVSLWIANQLTISILMTLFWFAAVIDLQTGFNQWCSSIEDEDSNADCKFDSSFHAMSSQVILAWVIFILWSLTLAWTIYEYKQAKLVDLRNSNTSLKHDPDVFDRNDAYGSITTNDQFQTTAHNLPLVDEVDSSEYRRY